MNLAKNFVFYQIPAKSILTSHANMPKLINIVYVIPDEHQYANIIILSM